MVVAAGVGVMYVIVHNAVSVDGRIDGFEPAIGVYYDVVDTWDVDAHLAGADTIIEGVAATDGDAVSADDDGPVLVVTDSRGRITDWEPILGAGFWPSVLVLCSETTPAAYREGVAAAGIECIAVGADRVDLAGALAALEDRGLSTVLVDSGGSL